VCSISEKCPPFPLYGDNNSLYLLYNLEIFELSWHPTATAVPKRKINGKCDYISVEVWAKCCDILQ
jgi:hypothetical protein